MFRLVLMAVVLMVIFFLSLDTMLRVLMEHNIRKQTGMDAEVGKVHLGLTEPVVSIENLKLYNAPEFGGTPFLAIPEIHVEYDRLALAEHKIHVTLLRFNLGELDIVKNEAGQTNIFSLGVSVPVTDKKSSGAALAEFKKQTGFEFKSVDVLNVSVGTAKYIDLKNPQNNREQKIDIENLVVKNVQSPADLAGLALLVALRSGDFFGSLVAPNAGLK
jgi:hypothetical protein